MQEATRTKIGFRNMFNLPVNACLLDCGCGVGFNELQEANDGFETHGFDVNKSNILKFIDLKTKQNITNILASIEKIPYANATFDVAYSSHVLEHVPNDKASLKEIHRILKTHGQLILVVPNRGNLSTTFKTKLGYANPYTDATHLREYSQVEIELLVKKSGFKITKVECSGFLMPIGDKVFQFFIGYLNLHKLVNFLAKQFPNRCSSIAIFAVKKIE